MYIVLAGRPLEEEAYLAMFGSQDILFPSDGTSEGDNPKNPNLSTLLPSPWCLAWMYNMAPLDLMQKNIQYK